MSTSLFAFDRTVGLERGARYVCGADEVGFGCWAGPLVVAAVRFDYGRLDEAAETRLAALNDSKKVSPRRRAALLPVILEVVDLAAVVVVSAAQIDRDGEGVVNMRALGGALRAVAEADSVNLVDWHELQDFEDWGFKDQPQRVKGGDRTSAAIAAASIVAKETRDRLMRELDAEHPGYRFASHKGYGTVGHEAAIRELRVLSPVHRRSVQAKVYAELGLGAAV
jgi:ribonuclease HII